jgi:hypothetical protein
VVSWFVVAVLGAAAAFELALALGAGSLGPEPGDGVPGERLASIAAVCAIVVGVVVTAVAAGRGHAVPPLLAPAAAAFLVAFFFTYDPYFALYERRYSDGGAASLSWILVVAGFAAGAGLLARVNPPIGSAATALMLAVVMLTFIVAGDGH